MANNDKKKSKAKSETARRRERTTTPVRPLLFSRENYLGIIAGLVVVVLGFILMSGGSNAPDEWDASSIYSFTRITLAPLVILGGLGIVIAAIFIKGKSESVQTEA